MEPIYIDKSPHKYHSFPFHHHKIWEITINLSGSGTATIDGQEYPFHQGTIFCVAPGILHRKESSEGFIDGSIMLQDFVPIGSSNVYQFEDDASGSFQYIFSLMFDVLMKDGPNARAIINSLADTMYQLMVGWSANRSRNVIVERFQKILLDNLSNRDFDISAESQKIGYSSSYFRKLFKKSTGASPTSYFNHLRIEYAKRQIQQYYGVRSMQEVALSSGFADPYYFSRVFRQYAGVNPMQYGKEIGMVKARKVNGEPLAR